MRTSILAAVVAVGLLGGQGAAALGLGPIEVESYLNQPFEASIPIIGTAAEDNERLAAFLAGPEAFEQAGLERPFVLALLQFRVVNGPEGPERIAVSSIKPIKEPVLNFVLELVAPQSRVLQEYTVLIDPAPGEGRAAAGRSAEAARTVSAATQAERASPPFEPAVPGAGERQPAAGSAAPEAEAQSAGSYGPVRARETLWSLAARLRPSEAVSVQQMMLALLRANPEAFAGGRLDGLHEGATLEIPPLEAIRSVSPEEAYAEVKRRYAAP